MTEKNIYLGSTVCEGHFDCQFLFQLRKKTIGANCKYNTFLMVQISFLFFSPKHFYYAIKTQNVCTLFLANVLSYKRMIAHNEHI